MRFRIHIPFIFLFLILFSVTSSLAGVKTAVKSPFAFLAVDSYEFEPVIDGAKVTYDFIIQNKGTATLKIENVKTGCGCTTVSYSREIPPDSLGKITVRVNTKGYGGRRLKKKIIAQTNDTNNSILYLSITGNVDKFADIIPGVVRLIGPSGKKIKTEVTIVPQEKYPFKIVKAGAENGKNINFKLKEVKTSSKLKYLLIIENQKKETGRYYDFIYLKTNSKINPEIRIGVYGNILDNHLKEETKN